MAKKWVPVKSGKLTSLGNEKLSGEVSTSIEYDFNKICHTMIDILNDREIKKLEEVEYINELGFMAQSHLISPLLYLCELSRLLYKKEWDNVLQSLKRILIK